MPTQHKPTAIPMAINRWLAVAMGATEGDVVRGFSFRSGARDDGPDEWRPTQGTDGGGWLNYVGGVREGYRALGWNAPGILLTVASSLPAGAGLSSSVSSPTAVAADLRCRQFRTGTATTR